MTRPARSKTIAFHKPYGVLSQFTPEASGQRTLADFGLPPGVYAAGRLDQDSEGLLILSSDRRLVHQLLEPSHAHPRIYLVQVERIPDEEALTMLRTGTDIRVGSRIYRTRPATVELMPEDFDLPPRNPPVRYRKSVPTAWLRLTLTEGKNRQVRRMTAATGFPTLRLIRVQIGHLALGDLEPGQWRTVQAQDVLGTTPLLPNQKA
ncbi:MULTISPECIES: pseudouridine synthase [unclassified Haematospirillum]|uniref:pseudouridine synthase n=1 Tax=unclassified Haematospirillum TaxID=2622088 RepID=UPI00143A7352|nr:MULTISPECIES: pseudouridine synthase [unclassified Haematospirillum]NKD55467.1 pseudouridine synthase [Haematospirillum sp. H4890]NKD75607.1 pseudouridine synthase [Haematospirillum sp. H4485]